MKTKQKEIKQYSIEDLIKDIDFVTIDVYNYLNEDIPKTLLKDYLLEGMNIIRDWYGILQPNHLANGRLNGLKIFYELIEKNKNILLEDKAREFLEIYNIRK